MIDNYCDIQLHGFCDASNVVYGACLYIRSRDKRGTVVSKLLCAKSRVAPLKTVTLPRLCGAQLLAQLYREAIGHIINVTFNKTIFWSDSTIVLHWLKTVPRSFKTFVANSYRDSRTH